MPHRTHFVSFAQQDSLLGSFLEERVLKTIMDSVKEDSESRAGKNLRMMVFFSSHPLFDILEDKYDSMKL